MILLGSLPGSWKGSMKWGALRFHLCHSQATAGEQGCLLHWSTKPHLRGSFLKKKRPCQLLEKHSASSHLEWQTLVVTSPMRGYTVWTSWYCHRKLKISNPDLAMDCVTLVNRYALWAPVASSLRWRWWRHLFRSIAVRNQHSGWTGFSRSSSVMKVLMPLILEADRLGLDRGSCTSQLDKERQVKSSLWALSPHLGTLIS